MPRHVPIPTALLGTAQLDEFRIRGLLQPGTVMVYAIGQAVGIEYDAALTLAQYIAVASGGRLDLLVYHLQQDDDHANYVMRRSFSEGFPRLGWICDACERLVLRADEVAYDVALVLTDEVELVPT